MCTFLGQSWALKLSYIERCVLDCCVRFIFFGWWTVNPHVIWVASNNVSLPCGTKLEEESLMNSQSIKHSVVVFLLNHAIQTHEVKSNTINYGQRCTISSAVIKWRCVTMRMGGRKICTCKKLTYSSNKFCYEEFRFSGFNNK